MVHSDLGWYWVILRYEMIHCIWIWTWTWCVSEFNSLSDEI